MSLTYTDIFCGAGGSSIGLTEAGFDLKLAANHWDKAIATHSANFPDAEHLIADISNYDMRRLPRTDVLWASPECTWHSPAGGRKRVRAQLDLLDDYVPTDGGIRSRATALDVVRAAEAHRYRAVIVENVVEFADWPMFDWWLDGLRQLDYTTQLVCVSTAHVGGPTNPYAPQWRDRLYIVCTAKGVPTPDVQPRPAAWCPACDELVAAVQSWKRPDRRPVGKYGQQYVYRCPNGGKCRHSIVEPFVLPAAAAIDWSDIGTRIADRARPLAAATMRRIEAGLRMFAQPVDVQVGGNTYERPGYTRAWPVFDAPVNARTGTPGDALAAPPMLVPAGGTWNNTPTSVDDPMRARLANEKGYESLVCPPFAVNVNHGGDLGRPYPIYARPLPPRTTKIGDGLVQPFVAMLRNHQTARAIDDPLSTISAAGRHHGLATPPGAFYVKHFTPRGDWAQMSKDVRTTPLGSITAHDHHSLVIPYRRGARPYPATDAPISAVATREQHGLMRPGLDVQDCHFRMLKPREHLRAQRFPDSYTVTGNQGEQTMQAGNAVSANVAHWLGEAIAAALDSSPGGGR